MNTAIMDVRIKVKNVIEEAESTYHKLTTALVDKLIDFYDVMGDNFRSYDAGTSIQFTCTGDLPKPWTVKRSDYITIEKTDKGDKEVFDEKLYLQTVNQIKNERENKEREIGVTVLNAYDSVFKAIGDENNLMSLDNQLIGLYLKERFENGNNPNLNIIRESAIEVEKIIAAWYNCLVDFASSPEALFANRLKREYSNNKNGGK